VNNDSVFAPDPGHDAACYYADLPPSQAFRLRSRLINNHHKINNNSSLLPPSRRVHCNSVERVSRRYICSHLFRHQANRSIAEYVRKVFWLRSSTPNIFFYYPWLILSLVKHKSPYFRFRWKLAWSNEAATRASTNLLSKWNTKILVFQTCHQARNQGEQPGNCLSEIFKNILVFRCNKLKSLCPPQKYQLVAALQAILKYFC